MIKIERLQTLNSLKYDLEKKMINKSKENNNNSFDDGVQKALQLSFENFTTLINQYLKYKDDIKLLMKEKNEAWKKWISYYENQNNISKSDFIERYNNWLFDYIFNKGIYQMDDKESIFEL